MNIYKNEGDFKMDRNVPFTTHDTRHGEGKIGIQRMRPRPRIMHQHIFFELIYVLSGTGVRRLEDTLTPICAGDYYVIDPRSVHCYEETDGLETLSCLFLPEYIDRALADCPSLASLLSNRILRFGVPVDIPIAERIFHDADGTVKRIVKHMEKEHTDGRTGYMELLRCYLTQVLVCAARACETRIPHKAVTVAMAYLKANYEKPLCLQTLSEQTGYTAQYLSGLFSSEMGMSIQEFLQQIRVEEACRLMMQRKWTTGDIAAAVGYQDARHFSKIFRRYRGISPREYQTQRQL